MEPSKFYKLNDLLKDYIPSNHSKQVNLDTITDTLFEGKHKIENVLDLGCGGGDSVDYFRKKSKVIKWAGLDIEVSPEVDARKRTDCEFITYDGINIPFADNHFDIIYTRQAFEHVRYPLELLKEVHRVLKPGGYFLGSTSQLEPYHAFSLWNYTPYGFSLIIDEAGLSIEEIRPGIDSLTLIIRRGLGRPRFFARWWEKESPLNKIISIFGKLAGKNHFWINSMKLIFCGQFCFIVRK
ncbi:MAG: class I SAM-dependent methyltransferase [candidate division Zixibacteria bacterium]|nr:class I SAM-dependent methyltransferase [candidate division Zixibacteria bacterium]